jgi:elongation factor 1 alpha-like protein
LLISENSVLIFCLTGSVLSDVIDTVRVANRLEAQIVIFNIDLPITCGFPVSLNALFARIVVKHLGGILYVVTDVLQVVFHYQALTLPAVVKRLISQLNRTTGEVVKKRPRYN